MSLHELLARLMGRRCDANETSVFTRSLEYVKSRVYEVRYTEKKARTLIPVDTSVPSGAETFVIRAWDWAGMAKIIDSYAADLPTVEVLAKEIHQGIKSLGTAYGYTIQDVRASQMAGTQLDVKKALAVRRANENLVERIASKGDAQAGLPGALNNPNVPLIVGLHDWTDVGTTAEEILSDLHLMASTVVENTEDTFEPDTIVLDTKSFQIASTRPYSSLNGESVLQVFLRSNPYIRNVDQWAALNAADAAGTGPRAWVYKRDPEILELVIPQEFEQLPPQATNLGFKVPCHSRIGGVAIYYPLAMAYGDGLAG